MYVLLRLNQKPGGASSCKHFYLLTSQRHFFLWMSTGHHMKYWCTQSWHLQTVKQSSFRALPPLQHVVETSLAVFAAFQHLEQQRARRPPCILPQCARRQWPLVCHPGKGFCPTNKEDETPGPSGNHGKSPPCNLAWQGTGSYLTWCETMPAPQTVTRWTSC